MLTAAQIQARIDAIRLQLSKQAGLKGTQFADQAVQFDNEDLRKELAGLEALQANNGTRLAGFSKGTYGPC